MWATKDVARRCGRHSYIEDYSGMWRDALQWWCVMMVWQPFLVWCELFLSFTPLNFSTPWCIWWSNNSSFRKANKRILCVILCWVGVSVCEYACWCVCSLDVIKCHYVCLVSRIFCMITVVLAYFLNRYPSYGSECQTCGEHTKLRFICLWPFVTPQVTACIIGHWTNTSWTLSIRLGFYDFSRCTSTHAH